MPATFRSTFIRVRLSAFLLAVTTAFGCQGSPFVSASGADASSSPDTTADAGVGASGNSAMGVDASAGERAGAGTPSSGLPPGGDAGTAAVDTSGPFFQDLGSNGRSCASCHVQADAWTITPGRLEARFDATQGTDPVFRSNDGAVCAGADVSTVTARRTAYALLLRRGLVRVELPIPDGAEFTLQGQSGVYCNPVSATALSMYRRPLPSTNLKFLSTVMWDGRETLANRTIRADLEDQANAATVGHAAGSALPAATRAQIVDFELGLFSAATTGPNGLALDAQGARGGAAALSQVGFRLGINDVPHDPTVFTLYDAWAQLQAGPTAPAGTGAQDALRAQIARGQDIFNHRPFRLDNVRGVIQNLQVTCSNCHETPDVGTHSAGRFFDLGLTVAQVSGADLPQYTLRNTATGETVQVSDPGRALITGKWVDLAAFKVAGLRNLAARGPYFHNGSAATIADVVGFYDRRFRIGLSPSERADLIAFLSSL